MAIINIFNKRLDNVYKNFGINDEIAEKDLNNKVCKVLRLLGVNDEIAKNPAIIELAKDYISKTLGLEWEQIKGDKVRKIAEAIKNADNSNYIINVKDGNLVFKSRENDEKMNTEVTTKCFIHKRVHND